MAKIEPANLLLKDKDGNSAIIKSLTDNDLNKLRVGLSDVSDLKTRVKAVEDNGYVSYNSVQTLNEEQCSQAQANMDAPGLSANNTFTGNMTVEANVKADSMTLNTSSDYAKLSASTNDHGIKLLGGSSDTTGASIDLRGSTDTNAPNTFTVSASNDVALVGSKTGSLTWNSENVVRKVNNLPADASGNVLLGTEKSTFNKVVFDTGYFSISTNATYKFDLTGSDLENVSKENVNVRLVAKVTTAHNSFEVGDIAQLTTSFDSKADNDVLGVCSYIQGNTLYLRSSANTALSINSGTGWMRKANVQIKAVLTAFIPDDGSILLIAEDQTNTSKLIGLPDGTLTWKDKNLVRSVNGLIADTYGNVNVKLFELQKDVQKSFTGTLSATLTNTDGTTTKTVTKSYNSYSNNGYSSSSSGGYTLYDTDTFTYGVTFNSTPTVSTSNSSYYRVSSATTTNAKIARYVYRTTSSNGTSAGHGPGYTTKDTRPAGTATATGQIISSKVVSETVSKTVNYGVTYKDVPTISNVVGCTITNIGTTACTVTTTLSTTLSSGQSTTLSSDFSFDVIGDVIINSED